MKPSILVALMLCTAVVACTKEPLMTQGIQAPRASGGAGAGLQLAVSAKAAVLSVTWKNAGASAIRVPTHVFAGEKHFDWLKVTLTDGRGAKRTLSFRDNRDESGAVFVDLAPGASATETIDLAAWAARAANGGKALTSGRYDADVVYDTASERRGWTGRLEARTTVDIP